MKKNGLSDDSRYWRCMSTAVLPALWVHSVLKVYCVIISLDWTKYRHIPLCVGLDASPGLFPFTYFHEHFQFAHKNIVILLHPLLLQWFENNIVRDNIIKKKHKKWELEKGIWNKCILHMKGTNLIELICIVKSIMFVFAFGLISITDVD